MYVYLLPTKMLKADRCEADIEHVLAENWKHLKYAEREPYDAKAIQELNRYVEQSRTYGGHTGNNPPASYQPLPLASSALSCPGRNPQAPSREHGLVKQEVAEHAPPAIREHAPPKPPQNTRLQKIIEEGSPEVLEKEVKSTNEFLDVLKGHLAATDGHELQDAKHWMQQIGKTFVTWARQTTNVS